MTTNELKAKIEKISGIKLDSDAYIIQAFTRSSLKDRENNEIFEAYGDSILSFCVMQLIHERFGFFRSDRNDNFKGENGYALKGIKNEAELDGIKKKLVSNATLAAQIDKWGLTQYLMMGKSDINNHIETQTKIKADLFEAIVGAIAVTCKFNTEILKNVVIKMLPIEDVFREVSEVQKQTISFTIDNAVTVLKELSEKGLFSEPKYEYSGPDNLGYYKNRDPIWFCRLTSTNFSYGVFSNSKRTAKKCEAYRELCRYFEITDEITRYIPGINKHRYIIEKDGKYIIQEENYSFNN